MPYGGGVISRLIAALAREEGMGTASQEPLVMLTAALIAVGWGMTAWVGLALTIEICACLAGSIITTFIAHKLFSRRGRRQAQVTTPQ